MENNDVRRLLMVEIKLENMSWMEVKEALENGFDTVIIPIGSIEQHGPHLPLGTDTFIGEVLAVRIAEKLGKTLVAPAITTGCSQHHMGFLGTLTFKPETLMRIIRDICTCLAKHGFKKIILLPTHGGNFAPVKTVIMELALELKDVKIISPLELEEFIRVTNSIMAEYGVSFREAGSHAGATETSLMLAIRNELVRMDKVVEGYTGDYTTSQLYSHGIKAISEIGILGDPRKANEEAGKRILEKLVEYYVEKIKREFKD